MIIGGGWWWVLAAGDTLRKELLACRAEHLAVRMGRIQALYKAVRIQVDHKADYTAAVGIAVAAYIVAYIAPVVAAAFFALVYFFEILFHSRG